MRKHDSGDNMLRVTLHVDCGAPELDPDLVARRVRRKLARYGRVVQRARVELAGSGNEVTCRLQLTGDHVRLGLAATEGDGVLAVDRALRQAGDELDRRGRRGRALSS